MQAWLRAVLLILKVVRALLGLAFALWLGLLGLDVRQRLSYEKGPCVNGWRSGEKGADAPSICR